MPHEIAAATSLSTKPPKPLRRCAPARRRRTRYAAHTAAAAKVVAAAAEAWDALTTHAATHATNCRHGAELADRTRHRWTR